MTTKPFAPGVYRLLFENNLDAALVTLPDGSILAANPAACAMFEMSEAEICAKGLAPLVVESPTLFLEEGGAWTGNTRGELSFKRRDGSILYGDVTSVVTDDGSKILLIIRDTTQQKLGEESVRDQQRQLAFALKAGQRANEALCHTQRQLEAELADSQLLQRISATLIKQNQVGELYEAILDAACSIMQSDFASLQMFYPERGTEGELLLLSYRGFTAEAAEFWEWVDAGSDSTCGRVLRNAQRVIAPDVETCDFMRGSKDLDIYRQTGIRAVQSTPLLSRTGAMLGMISTHWRTEHEPCDRDLRLLDILARQAADMLERKRSEIELRQSEERFRTYIETVPHLFFMADAKGNILNNNGRFFEYFGLDKKETEGTQWKEKPIHHPDDLERAIEGWNHAIRVGEPFEIEYRLRRKDGEYRWHLTRALPIRDAAGAIQEWVGTSTDIHAAREAFEEVERRVVERTAQLEATVRELQEKEQLLVLQSRAAAMGEMISNIAHQWRQPLNSLALVVQRLTLLYRKGLFTGEDLEQSVSHAMELIRHMSGTIDDFRNFFKPEKEKVHFRVNSVINDAIKLVRDTFESSGVKICVDSQSDPHLYGYPSHYSQVLLNLLSNAKDAFEGCGRTDREVRITLGCANGKSFVTVADNAGGIRSEIMPKIFEPHFTTKATQGTGIGLFMSKVIIEKHMNGRIGARNFGEGAEFFIEV